MSAHRFAPPPWFPAVAPILAGIRVVSPTAFETAGRHVDVRAHAPGSREDDFFDPDPLMHRLHRHLYAEHYAGGEPEAPAPAAAADGRAFLGALQAANARPAFLEEGWRVVETLRGGAVAAERAGRVHRWGAGEYLFDGAPDAPRRGSMVAVWRRAGSATVQTGFYYAFGAAVADGFDECCIVRYYLNLSAAGAAPALALLTRELDARGLPFAFKSPDHPAGYARRDSGVLYVAARHAPVTHAVLHALHPRLAPHLRPGVPLLTQRLAHGLAFAEEPENGDSFGAHRTRAMAEALVDAWRDGDASDEGVGRRVLARFEERGIDLDAPHLNARAADLYGLKTLEFGDGR